MGKEGGGDTETITAKKRERKRGEWADRGFAEYIMVYQ